MIYSGWAYTENEKEKQEENYEKFKELEKKYKISWLGESTRNIDDYDIVVDLIGYGYANKRYKVYKNTPDLSIDELALICDSGNLCFGYRYDGGIVIYTD